MHRARFGWPAENHKVAEPGFPFAGEDRPPTLWIACSDPTLDRSLRNLTVFPGDLVLRLPGPTLTSGPEADGLPPDFLLEAVESARVSRIVVFGHSPCGAFPDTTSPSPAPQGGTYERMVQRMRLRQAQDARARSNLIEQIAFLRRLPALRLTLRCSRLELLGLYLLPESGSLLVYEEMKGTFVPLASNAPS